MWSIDSVFSALSMIVIYARVRNHEFPLMFLCRTAGKDSKLGFMVYSERLGPEELVGQADVDLSAVMQKHRGKSMCCCARWHLCFIIISK